MCRCIYIYVYVYVYVYVEYLMMSPSDGRFHEFHPLIGEVPILWPPPVASGPCETGRAATLAVPRDDVRGARDDRMAILIRNIIPSGYVKIAIENGHRNSGFSHEKWWFSIVMLVYQRVNHGFRVTMGHPIFRQNQIYFFLVLSK